VAACARCAVDIADDNNVDIQRFEVRTLPTGYRLQRHLVPVRACPLAAVVVHSIDAGFLILEVLWTAFYQSAFQPGSSCQRHRSTGTGTAKPNGARWPRPDGRWPQSWGPNGPKRQMPTHHSDQNNKTPQWSPHAFFLTGNI